MPATTFTCPRCKKTSHNPHDAEEGYCGACHAFTVEPLVPVGRIDALIRLLYPEHMTPTAKRQLENVLDLYR